MSEKISVLIVDDSALMRNLIGRIIENTEDLEVAGKAMNGRFALAKLESLRPDVIILDLEMPEVNGIEFLTICKERGIHIPVIILSSLALRGAEVTMEALSLGACDFITKPSGSVSEDIHVVSNHLVELVRAYSKKKHAVAAPAVAAPQPPLPARSESIIERSPVRQSSFEICAIGISTGGPNALRVVFSHLDADFPLPIVVVQHMPAGFTAEFARSLDRICALEVKEAQDGDLVKKGRILIAPGDFQMEVEKKQLSSVVRVYSGPLHNGHRPSAGPLFSSVAAVYGEKAIGLIMTGMGRDGSAEIGEIHRAGGLTLGQDEASSIVFGMPRVAWELGNISRQIRLEETAQVLTRLSQGKTID